MALGRSGNEEQRRVRELTALHAVAAAMNQAMGEEDALTRVLTRVLDVLGLDAGRIFILDPVGNLLSLVTAQGNPALLDPTETSLIPGYCLCGIALESGELLRANDAEQDSRIIGSGCRNHPRLSCVAVPLLAKERMLGVLHVARLQHDGFSENEIALLGSIGAQVGLGVENMRLREEARRAETLSTLLQEMHHRIKNNLQTVADLLSLEAANSTSPEAQKSLRDSIIRIKSIAAVHQLLSVEQLRLTDITELARQVCGIFQQHLARPEQHLEMTVTGPAIFLPSKQATAVALVINEMAANAIEHAFDANAEPGRVHIELTQPEPDNRIRLVIRDNGRGLPGDFDLNQSGGLGLKIAQTLVVKDLAGTLQLDNQESGGARATIEFYQ